MFIFFVWFSFFFKIQTHLFQTDEQKFHPSRNKSEKLEMSDACKKYVTEDNGGDYFMVRVCPSVTEIYVPPKSIFQRYNQQADNFLTNTTNQAIDFAKQKNK